MTRLFALIACVVSGLVHAAAADENKEPPQEPATSEWISLSKDLGAFQTPTAPWTTAGNARLDPENPRRLVVEPGENAIVNGHVHNASPNLITKQRFGDVELAFDFMIPQGSNSGVKLHGIYEVQIRDTQKARKLTGDESGGIYPRADLAPSYHLLDAGIPPRVNAARAPGEWQTMTIAFRAPRFDADGRKIANARFEKVVLNGQIIHENAEIAHPTGAIWREKNLEHPTGSLMIQGDHGQVIFRNVRIRPLPAQ